MGGTPCMMGIAIKSNPSLKITSQGDLVASILAKPDQFHPRRRPLKARKGCAKTFYYVWTGSIKYSVAMAFLEERDSYYSFPQEIILTFVYARYALLSDQCLVVSNL